MDECGCLKFSWLFQTPENYAIFSPVFVLLLRNGSRYAC